MITSLNGLPKKLPHDHNSLKEKKKNWGSKIKRIENELEDVDIKYFKIHKSRRFFFPLPATNKQKKFKTCFRNENLFFLSLKLTHLLMKK